MAQHIIDVAALWSAAHSRGHLSTVGVVLSLTLGAAAVAGIGTAALDAAQGSAFRLSRTSPQSFEAAER